LGIELLVNRGVRFIRGDDREHHDLKPEPAPAVAIRRQTTDDLFDRRSATREIINAAPDDDHVARRFGPTAIVDFLFYLSISE
jgi:hypothetical protein